MALLNPFVGLEINSLGEHKGIQEECSREIPIIVSIDSSREDFNELPLTLYSLLNQSLKPDKIILWLDEEYEDFAYLPYEITQFVKNGLETLKRDLDVSRSIAISHSSGVLSE